VGFLLSLVGTRVVSSPRPFIVTGRPALIPSATDNGFPSDHTLLVATVAAVITLVDRRAGAVFWALALVVGVARVLAGVHHPIDVAGSVVIALIAAGIYLLARMLWERRSRQTKTP
jgi:undecaprenyl-diphosphatase